MSDAVSDLVEHPDEAARKDGFAIRGVLEAAAIIAVLLLVDRLLGNGDRFLGVSPHPFGLAVLLVACQYGAAEGAAAAVIACVAMFAFNLPEQSFEQDRVTWLTAVLREPLVWFTIALLVGGLAGRSRTRARTAEALNRQRAGEVAKVVEVNTSLSKRVSTLEARIAGQQRTITAVYEAARTMGPSRDAVMRGALALVRATIGATQCSIYTLEQGRLQLAGAIGWTDADGPVVAIQDGPFFEAVVGAQRSLVANRKEDRFCLDGMGVMAGPIMSAEGGVLGTLVVEAIPLTQLHFSAVANFRAICAWVGIELAQANEFEASQDSGLIVGGSRLVSARHAERLIAIMSATARRIRFDLALMQIEFSSLLDPTMLSDRRRVLLPIMDSIFRDTDIVLDDSDGRKLRVLMPGTPLRDLPLVSTRLMTAIGAGDPTLAADLDLSWLALNQTRPEMAAA